MPRRYEYRMQVFMHIVSKQEIIHPAIALERMGIMQGASMEKAIGLINTEVSFSNVLLFMDWKWVMNSAAIDGIVC